MSIKKIDWAEGEPLNTKGSHNYVIIKASKMSEVMTDNYQGANLVAFKATFTIIDETDPENPVTITDPTLQQFQDGLNETQENFSVGGTAYTVLKFPIREKYAGAKGKKGVTDGFDAFLDRIKDVGDPDWICKILTQMDYDDFNNNVARD